MISLDLIATVPHRVQRVRASVARRLRRACSRPAVWFTAPFLALQLLLLLPVIGLVYHIYFDRRGLPDLEPFIRFEIPTIGHVYDTQGTVLVELAREYRRIVSYDEVPLVLRHAILAAEDKNFFSHSGVEYLALPRVLYKTALHSVAAWRKGAVDLRLRFPQGGSTLTQQLVRGYFLRDRSSRENGTALFRNTATSWVLSAALGVPTTNKLLRKMEEIRLSLWLEEEMQRRYGSREQAKREIFARSASFNYLGNGRYGFATGSEYYFGKPLSSYTSQDAAKAALLAGITKAPRDYAPADGNPRPLRRRNEILALMARNGSIPESLAASGQAEPILVSVTTISPVKTRAPAAVGTVFDELKQHGAGRFGIEDLFQGRISVRSTVDERVQTIVNEALENGLARYEKRHPGAKGLIQGSVVVLRNADAAILAEAGGRQVYNARPTEYSDYNRATGSLRQPGSAWKPLVYLAAFRRDLSLDTVVPDEPIAVPMGADRPVKWISNYDNQFKGPIPMRQALAESRNAVAVWITREIGVDQMIETARAMGIRSPLQRYITTALGASEVRLLELAGAYRAMASGILAEPHIIDRVTAASGEVLYEAARSAAAIDSIDLSMIQEGLRGVIRLPEGTAHALNNRDFPVPVMGKTGTTSDFRDALFVGSTYGAHGVTVAVRVGFDDNRVMGEKETGGRTALPIFREIMLRVYERQLVGPVPKFPREIEDGIDRYLVEHAARQAERDTRQPWSKVE
ncbi:MAG TPA: transglycosylase domain-containing protein [Candidatus Limnocylindrales bacterium]|nr:transglycosylase domain-containing protein [Candidatus Limnocylindrales bacterium]